MKHALTWKFLSLIALNLSIYAAKASESGQKSPEGACPDLAQGETLLDCPWADVGREVASALKQGASIEKISALLFERVPRLKDDFALDARQARLRDLWGTSQNYDESTRREIIPAGLLQAISIGIGAQGLEGRIAHAGAQHTYGYLFSIEKTPYGYKRARWVREDIEKGFELPRGTLSPRPSVGSLLSNITWFAARLALQDDPRTEPILSQLKGQIPRALTRKNWDTLPGRRLIEKVSLGEGITIEIRTDFIPFTRAPSPQGTGQPEPNSELLIYSVRDSRDENRARLITLFPIQKSFAEKALANSELGTSRPVSTRYNAWVPGFSDRGPIMGLRKQVTRQSR